MYSCSVVLFEVGYLWLPRDPTHITMVTTNQATWHLDPTYVTIVTTQIPIWLPDLDHQGE